MTLAFLLFFIGLAAFLWTLESICSTFYSDEQTAVEKSKSDVSQISTEANP